MTFGNTTSLVQLLQHELGRLHRMELKLVLLQELVRDKPPVTDVTRGRLAQINLAARRVDQSGNGRQENR